MRHIKYRRIKDAKIYKTIDRRNREEVGTSTSNQNSEDELPEENDSASTTTDAEIATEEVAEPVVETPKKTRKKKAEVVDEAPVQETTTEE